MAQSQGYVARQFVKAGIKVFPCNIDKSPLTKNGFKDASDDPLQIESWWDKYPDALVGAPNDQFTVIDVDDYDIPKECKWIVDGVISNLKSQKILSDDSVKVTTMSGGTHYYFMRDSSISRMIHVLPQIDILASGGYVILPDQKNYIAKEDSPWEYFEFLPKLDVEGIRQIADEVHETTLHTNRLVKEHRKQTKTNKPSKSGKHYTPKYVHQTDINKYNEVKEEHPDKKMGAIDYENDRIQFDIKEGIYKRSNRDIEKSNPNEKLLDENGQLHIDEGVMDSSLLMRLFYNREVQERLVLHMGLPTPNRKGKLTKSILPGHIDSKPSMGVRWSKEDSHILIRDFSNHFNDKYEQVDYNVVRLYCTLKYGTNVPRLNAPEFTTWFMRMLVDSDILNIDRLKTPFVKDTSKLNSNQKKMLESLQLLDAIKKFHKNYDGTFVAADKFISAWSGLSVSTCNRHKKFLVEKGYIVNLGKYNCVKERSDGFFNTILYKMAEMVESEKQPTIQGKTMKLNEAVSLTNRNNNTIEIKQDKDEKKMQDRYPSLSTYAGFVVAPQYHEKIQHFAEDFGIENVPDSDNMMIPVYVDTEFRELDEMQIDPTMTYYIDRFEFEITDGVDNNKLLIAHGICPPILEMIHDAKERYGYDVEDPDVQFVVSSDLEDFDGSRIDHLELMFNSYVPRIGTNRFEIKHMTEEQILLLMDGWNPITEE